MTGKQFIFITLSFITLSAQPGLGYGAQEEIPLNPTEKITLIKSCPTLNYYFFSFLFFA